MKQLLKSVSVSLILLLTTACMADVAPSIDIPAIQDSFEQATLTPIPTEISPTSTPVPGGVAATGQTFYKAWEKGDYVGMYSLLSPQSQSLVGQSTFVSQYQRAEQIATVNQIMARPLAAEQDGNRGLFEVQVVWETATVGTIMRNHTVELIFSDGRWGLIWDDGLILPELKGGKSLSFEFKSPSRANIYDINGRALAFQGAAVRLGVVPGEISDETGLLNTISPLLNQSPEKIQERYATAQPDWYVPLGDVAQDLFTERYDTLKPYFEQGLRADERLTRLYFNAAPHIVGYLGAIPEGSVNDYIALGYAPDARVGVTGIEGWGESYLSGTRGGVLSVINQSGAFDSVLAQTEPKQARDIYTTFDLDFQLAVEEALAEAALSHPVGSRGAVVVMDIKTGAIKAMASYPTYDPSVFDVTRPDAGAALTALFNDQSRPLVNRATQGLYPPGSTFKLVTLGAAVNSGLYTVDSRYNSTGTWSGLGENFIKTDWRQGGHGNISLKFAIVVSCNTCFYDAGFNMNEQDPYLFPNVARQFGLDDSTGIIGLNDLGGTIPDPEWKLENTAEGGWVPGDAVNMSIGQGYVEVTPLQMARLTAAVAHNGQMMVPTVVDRIGSGGGAPEEKIPAQNGTILPYDQATLVAMQEALYLAANDGSGTSTHVFAGLPMQVSGKTGTAETPQGIPHGWFIGYGPSNPIIHPVTGERIAEPEIAIAVILENSDEGSKVGAPIFRRVMELYYGFPLTPYPWQQ